MRQYLPLVALFYLLLLLPEFWPFLGQHKTLYQGDIFLYFEPVLRYLGDAVRHGRLPLWNPLVCNGIPQIAIISPGIFYPPNWLFFVLPFGTALGAVMMFHQWLAGYGAFLLARREGFGMIASTVCGAMLMLSGYMFGSSQCYTLPATFSWTPLGLWFIGTFALRKNPSFLVALGILFALQIYAGRPELFLSAAVLYVFYGLMNKVPIVSLLLALACGGLLAAPALLPVFELYSLSPRMSGLRMSEVSLWSAGWFDWLQMLLCRPFGDLVVSNYHLSPHYPGLFPYISSLYLGPAVLTLSVFGWVNSVWKKMRIFWGVTALLFFLLALGSFGPLLPAIHQLSPGLVVLRYPIKVAVFALFAICMAAGAGWDFATRQGVKREWAQTLAAVWIFVLAFAVLVWLDAFDIRTTLAAFSLGSRFSAHGATLTSLLKMTAIQAAAVAALGLLSLVLIPQLRKTVRSYELKRFICAGTLASLALAPMAIAGCAALWHYTDQAFYSQKSELVDFVKQNMDGRNRILVFPPDSIVAPQWMWRPDQPSLFSIVQSQYERGLLYGDVNMSYNIRSAYGFVPTDTLAFSRLYTGVCSRSHQLENFAEVSDLPLARFCQVCAVKYMITLTVRPNPKLHVIESMPLLDEDKFEIAHEDENQNLRVYEVRNTLPRVYMTYNWKPVRSQVEALKDIFWADRSEFDPTIATMLQTNIAPIPDAGEPIVAADVTGVSDKSESVTVDCNARRDGFLVLADTDYPGWKAYVDGKSAEIVQANGLHKAVALKPGQHRVVFQYRPHSVIGGFVLAGLAVLGLFVLLMPGKQRRDG